MAKKGARSTGGGKGRRRERDQRMAQELKKRGVGRDYGRCPICNSIVSLKQVYNHIATHK